MCVVVFSISGCLLFFLWYIIEVICCFIVDVLFEFLFWGVFRFWICCRKFWLDCFFVVFYWGDNFSWNLLCEIDVILVRYVVWVFSDFRWICCSGGYCLVVGYMGVLWIWVICCCCFLLYVWVIVRIFWVFFVIIEWLWGIFNRGWSKIWVYLIWCEVIELFF